MSPAEDRRQAVRLKRVRKLARELATAERRLGRALEHAHSRGDSLRELSAASGIPRVTLARRLEKE